MELWGGVECTINRVGDHWHDQLALSGHGGRLEDLDRIAELGIVKLRYPVLWEAVAAGNDSDRQWQWADARLRRLRQLGVEPIIGLVHHGSGPRHTSLVEPSFAPGLGDFAGRVAARYPWAELYTPVNEPLTTARFSGLYGLWFPHGRDDRVFARALMNQCQATVLAMRAIRRANPAAKLVQTEDLGTTYGTAHMRYQCDFDNERRWLTWDLLCGRVDRDHPLYRFLTDAGVSPRELATFVDAPCPPDLLGVNHYVTSDRYLDERHCRYDRRHVGGNWKEAYADVEAVRVLAGEYRGFRVLEEAWRRYRVPIALTEVHMGCSREEQMRWCIDAWRAAQAAVAAGCDVRAVTFWALLGAFNWDTLLTRADGRYESGAFDVRTARPRRTALARLIPALARGGAVEPAARGAGWWQRPDKVLYRGDRAAASGPHRREDSDGSPPLLLVGAGGSLGRAFLRACEERGLRIQAVAHGQLDICDAAAVARLVGELQPWALINAAGFVRVDEAEVARERCFGVNTTGAGVLLEAARGLDIPLLTFSSDLVFDGVGREPYVEESATRPLNEYGRSKEAAERACLGYARTLCVRTAAFFGSVHGDFVVDALQSLMTGRTFCAPVDVIVSPTYVPDLVSACLDLLIDGEGGIVHLVNQGALSWAEWAQRAANACDVDDRTLQPRCAADMGWSAARPAYSALASDRVAVMPTLDDALRRFACDWRSAQRLRTTRRASCRAL